MPLGLLSTSFLVLVEVNTLNSEVDLICGKDMYFLFLVLMITTYPTDTAKLIMSITYCSANSLLILTIPLIGLFNLISKTNCFIYLPLIAMT